MFKFKKKALFVDNHIEFMNTSKYYSIFQRETDKANGSHATDWSKMKCPCRDIMTMQGKLQKRDRHFFKISLVKICIFAYY